MIYILETNFTYSYEYENNKVYVNYILKKEVDYETLVQKTTKKYDSKRRWNDFS